MPSVTNLDHSKTTYYCQKWDIKLFVRESHRVATTETAIMDCQHSWMGATKSFIITLHFTEVMNDLCNVITPRTVALHHVLSQQHATDLRHSPLFHCHLLCRKRFLNSFHNLLSTFIPLYSVIQGNFVVHCSK